MGEKSKRESQQVADRDFHRSVKEELTTEWVLRIGEMDYKKKRKKKIPLYAFPNMFKRRGIIKNHSKWQSDGCWENRTGLNS